MIKYCLNIEELREFIDYALYQSDVSSNVREMFDAAENWQAQSNGLAYFLGRIIQKKVRQGTLSELYINDCYQLSERVFFDINDTGASFISYLLMHDGFDEPGYELEEKLTLLHSSYSDRKYGRSIHN